MAKDVIKIQVTFEGNLGAPRVLHQFDLERDDGQVVLPFGGVVLSNWRLANELAKAAQRLLPEGEVPFPIRVDEGSATPQETVEEILDRLRRGGSDDDER